MTTLEPGSPPPPPIQPGGTSTGAGASSQALTALIIGILGFVSCCFLLSPVAWYLGNQELHSIREGRSPAAGEPLANIGRILGIVGTVLLGFAVLWMFLGGFAIVMAALHNATS
jgi:hypothetical protein